MKKGLVFGTLVIIMVSLVLIASIPAVQVRVTETKLNKVYVEKDSFISVVNECDSDLVSTAECFLGNIKPLFEYKNNEDFLYMNEEGVWLFDGESTSRKVSDEEIFIYVKENGGVCYDWSILYLKLCEETDFECELVIENRMFPTQHSYTIISNSTHFCKLDQLNLECGETENE